MARRGGPCIQEGCAASVLAVKHKYTKLEGFTTPYVSHEWHPPVCCEGVALLLPRQDARHQAERIHIAAWR
jgi:hypothetical protein